MAATGGARAGLRRGAACRALLGRGPGPRAGVGLTSGQRRAPARVRGPRVSRPALIFDDVESLSSETEEKRPLHAGNEMHGAVRPAPGCPGPRGSPPP